MSDYAQIMIGLWDSMEESLKRRNINVEGSTDEAR